jgi:hypothetical protein
MHVLDLGARTLAEVLRVRLDIVKGALVVEDHHGLSVRVSRRFHRLAPRPADSGAGRVLHSGGGPAGAPLWGSSLSDRK